MAVRIKCCCGQLMAHVDQGTPYLGGEQGQNPGAKSENLWKNWLLLTQSIFGGAPIWCMILLFHLPWVIVIFSPHEHMNSNSDRLDRNQCVV